MLRLIASPFVSSDAFREHFSSGLGRLLDAYDELGIYILVLANAHFDAELWSGLRPAIEAKFNQLAADLRYRNALGLVLDDAEDDLLVFRRLVDMGLDGLADNQQRNVGPWELQFNPLRALRPSRMANQVTHGISVPFDPESFNFNKPFLRKEILWEGWLCGRSSTLFYNKFPFVELHGLMVPGRRNGLPQLLRREDNDYLWRLTELLSRTMSGVGFGYNSYGASASVNHLHFQMFQRRDPLPLESSEWRHNGGQRSYPLHCHVFCDAARSWRFISELHRKQISYNLIYLPGRLYCLPRQKQGAVAHASWSSGPAWYDLAGGFTTFGRHDFQRLQQQDLEQELARLAIAIEPQDC
jgi:hypothetical protein